MSDLISDSEVLKIVINLKTPIMLTFKHKPTAKQKHHVSLKKKSEQFTKIA